jgi:hypothetical protein
MNGCGHSPYFEEYATLYWFTVRVTNTFYWCSLPLSCYFHTPLTVQNLVGTNASKTAVNGAL